MITIFCLLPPKILAKIIFQSDLYPLYIVKFTPQSTLLWVCGYAIQKCTISYQKSMLYDNNKNIGYCKNKFSRFVLFVLDIAITQALQQQLAPTPCKRYDDSQSRFTVNESSDTFLYFLNSQDFSVWSKKMLKFSFFAHSYGE